MPVTRLIILIHTCCVVVALTLYRPGSLTLSSLNLPLSSSSQAANCCRNSRLVVDEDDLVWVIN